MKTHRQYVKEQTKRDLRFTKDLAEARMGLLKKLAVAQAQSASGKKGTTHTETMKKLKRRARARPRPC